MTVPPRRHRGSQFVTALRGEAVWSAMEQRKRDLALFERLQRRRWMVILVSLGLIAAAKTAGFVAAPLNHLVWVASVALGWSVAYEGLRRRGWYAWYHIYVSAAWDVLLVSSAVFLAGQGGLVIFYVLALAPYLLEVDRPAGAVVVVVSPFAYLATRVLHARWYDAASGVRTLGDLPPQAFLDALLFVVVGLAMLRGPTALAARIRATRGLMAAAETGDLSVRTQASEPDELGYLERSFNEMLAETGRTVSTVQRESDEVAAHSEELAASASQFADASDSASKAAARLSTQLSEQDRLAEASGARAGEAAAESAALHEKASGMADQARQLVRVAETNRERIARAGTALVEIGEQVHEGAAAVSALSPLSESIGKLASAISRVARQTNLLALNASIEAARAGEHGRGFAVVAAEVRKLAREAGEAARQVGVAAGEIRVAIGAAVDTMGSGEAKVRDVGAVAAEADGALAEMLHGVAALATLVDEASATTAGQAHAMEALTDAMHRMRDLSAASAAESVAAAQAADAQTTGAETLTATARELAQLAERMRSAISRFTVNARPGERA